MDKRFELVHHRDSVLHVSFQGRKSLFSHANTFRIDNFLAKIMQVISVSEDEKKGLFDEGVNCEILRPNASWQKGRIRICLEFCPDEPEVEVIPAGSELEISQSESPLADIRQMVTENHQQSNS